MIANIGTYDHFLPPKYKEYAKYTALQEEEHFPISPKPAAGSQRITEEAQRLT